MSFTTTSPASVERPQVRVRHISQADVSWALSQGWKDFQAKRGDVLLIAVLYPVIGLVAAAATFSDDFVPLFFPLVAGLSILGPAAATGFYELAKRREEGLDAGWSHFFEPLRDRRLGTIAYMTAVLLVLFVVWLAVAWTIYTVTLGRLEPQGAGDFLGKLFTTPNGWALIFWGDLAGFGFALVVLVLSLVAFPMAVDRPVDPGTAMGASVQAVTRNPAAAASWGLRVAALLILSSIPAFVGLAVVLPVLGYATWHLYTRLVER